VRVSERNCPSQRKHQRNQYLKFPAGHGG
jgi:hypothetical protein